MTLNEQLKAFGHARVVVVLKPKKTRKVGSRTALALSETVALQQDAAGKLQTCFKRFEQSRTQLLAAESQRQLPAVEAKPLPVRASASKPAAARYYPNLGVMLGTVDKRGLKALRKKKKEVATVLAVPDFSLIQPHEVSALAGPPTGISWGVKRLGVPKLWDKGLTGNGILIGHLDTGVDKTHPALSTAVDVFAEFDLIGEEIPNALPRDTHHHGTHTAGLLSGRPHAGLTFGVAPGAKLASAVVIEGGDVPARTIAGLDWAIGQGCRIVSLSLGVRGFHPQFSTILKLVRQRNVLPVVAVGNEGAQTSRSPGNHVEVLSVGAIDELDAVWLFSSSQALPTSPQRVVPDLVGPGVAVWSSIPNAGLLALSGTSMATPHVAGLAALLMEHKPEATADEVEEAIFRSCTRPAGASTVRVNRGVPDASKALEELDNGA
jgi:subtilisin